MTSSGMSVVCSSISLQSSESDVYLFVTNFEGTIVSDKIGTMYRR
jgi:hypothetical protein